MARPERHAYETFFLTEVPLYRLLARRSQWCEQ